MAYRCFNDECERGGEDQAPRVGYNLVGVFSPGVSGECEGCERPLYFHDSLYGNDRTDGDGHPIDVDAPLKLRSADKVRTSPRPANRALERPHSTQDSGEAKPGDLEVASHGFLRPVGFLLT